MYCPIRWKLTREYLLSTPGWKKRGIFSCGS
jgi:hypothetical protein